MIYLGTTLIDATSPEYAKKQWVQNQGYMTELPATTATKDYVDGSIGTLNTSVNNAIDGIETELTHKYSFTRAYRDFTNNQNWDELGIYNIPLSKGTFGDGDAEVDANSYGYVVINDAINVDSNMYGEFPVSWYGMTDYIGNELSTKQNTLVSGTNIKTINNQSILGSGNLSLDLQLYQVVQSLPSQDINVNKIYLLPISDGSTATNQFDEYMYVNNTWEKIGSIGGSQIDLTDYLTIADASQNFATKASLADYVQTTNLDTAVSNLNYVKSSTLSNYLTTSTASQTYLTIADASTTYVKDASLDSKVTGLGYAKTSALPTAYSDLTNDKGYKAIVLCTEAEYAAMVSGGTVDPDTVYLTH